MLPIFRTISNQDYDSVCRQSAPYAIRIFIGDSIISTIINLITAIVIQNKRSLLRIGRINRILRTKRYAPCIITPHHCIFGSLLRPGKTKSGGIHYFLTELFPLLRRVKHQTDFYVIDSNTCTYHILHNRRFLQCFPSFAQFVLNNSQFLLRVSSGRFYDKLFRIQNFFQLFTYGGRITPNLDNQRIPVVDIDTTDKIGTILAFYRETDNSGRIISIKFSQFM